MEPAAAEIVDWSRIDHVLLDMDGTVLDLAFDTHFWRDLVPLHYAQAQGITDPNFGSIAIALLGAGTAVGRFFSGAISDRIGRARHIQVNALAASLCLWLWPTATTEQTLLTFSFFYGMFTAAVFTALPLVIANQYGPTNVAVVFAVLMLVAFPAGTASAPIVAAWYQDSGSFLGSQLYSGGIMLIAFAFWCGIEDKQEDNVPRAAATMKPPRHATAFSSAPHRGVEEGGKRSERLLRV